MLHGSFLNSSSHDNSYTLNLLIFIFTRLIKTLMQELLQLPIDLGTRTLKLSYINQGPGCIHYRAIPKSFNSSSVDIPWFKFSLPYEIPTMAQSPNNNSYIILLLCGCREPLKHPYTPHLQHSSLSISRDILDRFCNICEKVCKTCVVLYNPDNYLNIELELYDIQLRLFNYNSIMIILPSAWHNLSIIHL